MDTKTLKRRNPFSERMFTHVQLGWWSIKLLLGHYENKTVSYKLPTDLSPIFSPKMLTRDVNHYEMISHVGSDTILAKQCLENWSRKDCGVVLKVWGLICRSLSIPCELAQM